MRSSSNEPGDHLGNPAPMSHGEIAKLLDGQDMLSELATLPGAVAVLEAFRAAQEWALAVNGNPAGDVSPPGIERSRGGEAFETPLFDENLRSALETIRGFPPGTGRSGTSSPGAQACEQVSAWAAERRLLVTQLHFACTAVLFDPDDPSLAYQAGRVARDLARWDIAEKLLEHSIAVAGRQRDREAQATSMTGLANLHSHRGNYRAATKLLEAALDFARQHRLKSVTGVILHDLMGLNVLLKNYPLAEALAREALEAYGIDHANTTALIHDLALIWLEREQFHSAASMLSALPHYKISENGKAVVLANLALAEAGCGRLAAARKVWNDSWAIVRGLDSRYHGVTAAALRLSEAAAWMEDWCLARQAAEHAQHLAEARDEIDVVVKAEAVLARVEMRIGGPDRLGGGPTTSDQSSTFADQLIQSLVASNFVTSLNASEQVIPQSHPLSEDRLGRLLPHPLAAAPHTSFFRHTSRRQILEYTTFVPSTVSGTIADWALALSFGMEGPASFNRATLTDVPPPHVHDPSVPGGVRAALPDEIPARPW